MHYFKKNLGKEYKLKLITKLYKKKRGSKPVLTKYIKCAKF